MGEVSSSERRWRILRRVLISLAVLVTLVALFYVEEDWRGQRAWDKCKAEAEAKGAVMDWLAYIPPQVPDDKNFFKAPKMEQWFAGRGGTELSRRLSNPKTAPAGEDPIKTEADAREYLAWSDQFTPDFDSIRNALKRPYARMEGDYTQPFAIPIPNFISTRIVVQTLAQRAHCYLLLAQPDKALQQLLLMHDMCRLLENAPTGKPMTLVGAMIDVAVTRLFVDSIAEGFQRQAWHEPQLTALQKELGKINLVPSVVEAFETERVSATYTLEKTPPKLIADQFINLSGDKPGFWRRLKNPFFTFLTFAPRGWVYQNMVNHVRVLDHVLESYDSTNDLIFPGKAEKAADEISAIRKPSPYTYLEAIILPNFSKATEALAYTQVRVKQAQIACALERFRYANGQYPESLEALMPQFIETLPRDVIGGAPFHYRRSDDGQFVLYSVGWNETNDGAKSVTTQNGSADLEKGDWVWQSAER